MLIQHNGKKYKWIGDKWGKFKVLEIFDLPSGVGVLLEEIGGANPEKYTTGHSPEQLVKLGYMEEAQEQEEKCNHISDGLVYASIPPQYKCKKCGKFSTEYMPMEEKQEEGCTSFDMHPEIPDFVYEEPQLCRIGRNLPREGTSVYHIGKQVEILTKYLKGKN